MTESDKQQAKLAREVHLHPSVTHTLKTLSPYFRAVASGLKCFEVRENDRDFRVDDILLLMEIEGDAKSCALTGNILRVRVLMVWRNLPGVASNYVVMSIKKED